MKLGEQETKEMVAIAEVDGVVTTFRTLRYEWVSTAEEIICSLSTV